MSHKSEQFLKDFFDADGHHPNGDEARRLFEQAFVPPTKLKNLADVVVPDKTLRKVVIVDGHPRSGKTWGAVKVMADLIDNWDLSPAKYWTSGVDSLKVAPNDETNLLDSLRNAADVITTRKPLSLVFLDDLLGTNRIRPLDGFVRSREEIVQYFQWNRENPFLRAMSEASILVITGRSLHVTLVELLLGIDLRASADPEYVTVLNPRRGLFQTSRKGDPFGSFDQESLREACRRNRKYHPFSAPENSDWLVMAVPLIAFDQEERISEAQERFAASVLFGDDLKCLADQIVLLESVALAANVPDWLPKVLASLRAAYLVMVAPGFVFLDPAAYEALGIEQELSAILVRSLYLYESDGAFRSGRLPNEMYMLAVDDHLRDTLGFAARNFTTIAAPVGDGGSVAPSLGLRGLIERALHIGGQEELAKLLSVPEFHSYAESHQRDTRDAFLHLELTQCLPEQPNTTLSAGLVTAIGWSLYNFRGVYGPDRVKEALETWFPIVFDQYMQTLEGGTIPQSGDAVIIYSTFLQWVLKICDKHQKCGEAPDWAKPIINLCERVSEQMRESLEMVLEDEIVWALNEKYSLPPTARAFIESREDTLRRAISDTKSPDDESDSNRFFSLAWHNEWMEQPLVGRTQVLRLWMDSQRDRLQKMIAERPKLIVGNLSYHWCHFVTQRAVWMRDWCLSDNPLESERKYSQITRGSVNPSDNNDLQDIALAILRRGDANGVRTVMLLVGTRAARMPRFGEFRSAVKECIRIADGPAAFERRVALLHAVFELVRQGFFDPFSEDTTEECRALCLDLLNDSKGLLSQAWSSYWGSLRQHTHHDVLPREREGWKDVKEALRSRDQG